MGSESFAYAFLHSLIVNMERTVSSLYGPLMNEFRPLGMIIIGIWVALVGYLFIKGKLREAGPEFLVSTLLMTIVAAIVFTPSMYSKWVYTPVVKTMTDLSSFFVSPTGAGGLKELFVGLDRQFGKVFQYIESVSDEAGMRNLSPLFFAAVMSLIFGILYAVFVLFMAVGYFGVNVMMVIGGIFIFFAPFKGTRFMFASWIRTLANYALVPVFTALVMSVTLTFIEGAFADLAAQSDSTLWSREMANALLVGCLGIFFHLKASEFAAAITGGQPAGMMGMLSMAPMAAAGMASGLRFAGQASGVNKMMNRVSAHLGQGRDAALSGLASAPGRAYSAMRGILRRRLKSVADI